MRVLIIGANGQLGSDLVPVLHRERAEVKALSHADLEVCDVGRLDEIIGSFHPDFVINTAAYHRVEECETNVERSFRINAEAVRDLAKICENHGAVLMHFSTDYVFGRDAARRVPYSEIDLPAPVNIYGVSKAAGEMMVPFHTSRYYLLRVCGLYGVAGSSGKGGNFVETMLRKAMQNLPIRVVDDQTLTPTATTVLAEGIVKLIKPQHPYGLYHMICEGQCTWYEFARAIFEEAGVAADLTPVKTHEFASTVRRPEYSVLSTEKLRAAGVTLPHWREGLKRYLAARADRGRVTSTAPVASALV